MPCFLRQRASIEFWIKEILREKDIAVYERRTQTTSLIGPSFPQRVVNIESKVAREPPPERRLQSVVDHRLLTAQVVTAEGTQCGIRPDAGLSVEGVRQWPVHRKISAIRAHIVDFGHQRGSKRTLKADQRLDGIWIRQIRIDQ